MMLITHNMPFKQPV